MTIDGIDLVQRLTVLIDGETIHIEVAGYIYDQEYYATFRDKSGTRDIILVERGRRLITAAYDLTSTEINYWR
jgi:hypothetical protein